MAFDRFRAAARISALVKRRCTAKHHCKIDRVVLTCHRVYSCERECDETYLGGLGGYWRSRRDRFGSSNNVYSYDNGDGYAGRILVYEFAGDRNTHRKHIKRYGWPSAVYRRISQFRKRDCERPWRWDGHIHGRY